MGGSGQMRGLPPGPRAPVVVNTARFLRRPTETLLGWRRRYGDIFTVKVLLYGVGVYLCDPEAVREILTGDQSDLHVANGPLLPALGEHSILTLDGPEHLRQRKLLMPPLQGSAIQSFRTVIRDAARTEVGSWREGERFVMRERMGRLTFEVIARAVFGMTAPERIERLHEAMTALLGAPAVFLMPQALRRDLGRWSPWGWFQQRLRDADALLYEEIAARRCAPDIEDREDVLSLLLRTRDEEGRPMTDAELRDDLIAMLLAGHETTAIGLAWAFDLLPRNRHVLARLRDELAAGDDDTYLDAVVTETLRMRPILPAGGRVLTKPRTIGGWDLPPGILVHPAIAILHMREDLFPRAHEFRPERFIEDKAKPYT